MITVFDNLINNETEHKKVLSDCDLCGSKQVSCLYFKLRDNFAATMRNDDYYKEVSDTAIRGTEKYVCYVCISDIITETMVKYQQASFKPTTIKPSEPKKVKQVHFLGLICFL